MHFRFVFVVVKQHVFKWYRFYMCCAYRCLFKSVTVLQFSLWFEQAQHGILPGKLKVVRGGLRLQFLVLSMKNLTEESNRTHHRGSVLQLQHPPMTTLTITSGIWWHYWWRGTQRLPRHKLLRILHGEQERKALMRMEALVILAVREVMYIVIWSPISDGTLTYLRYWADVPTHDPISKKNISTLMHLLLVHAVLLWLFAKNTAQT